MKNDINTNLDDGKIAVDTDILKKCASTIPNLLEKKDPMIVKKEVGPAIFKLVSVGISDNNSKFLTEITSTLFKVFDSKFCEEFYDKYVFPSLFNEMRNSDSVKIGILSDLYSLIILNFGTEYVTKTHIPFIISLSKNDNIFARAICLQVIINMCGKNDFKIRFKDINEIFSYLSTDPSTDIKENLLSFMALYCPKLTSREEKLYLSGRFNLMSRDPNPSVRHRAMICLRVLSDALDMNERKYSIMPCFSRLLDDPNYKIKHHVSLHIGRFIFFIGKHVDPKIVARYCRILSNTYEEEVDNYNAAHAFSAVAVTIGKERWGEIYPSLLSVLSSPSERNRRTLAYALKVYYEYPSEKELQNIIFLLLRDFSRVKIGVIMILDLLLSRIDDKQMLLSCLQDPNDKFPEWRYRKIVSEQIRACSKYFSVEDLAPSVINLIYDEVYVIRKDAMISFIQFLDCPIIQQAFSDLVTDTIFTNRLTAAQIFELLDKTLFQKFIDLFLILCKDSIPNIRIVCCRSIANKYNQLDQEYREKLFDIIKALHEDNDPDVRTSLSTINL